MHGVNVSRCGASLHVCAVVVFLDKISSTNPRVIDDGRARQLCSDVRRCTYYETCATYGLNVNRVFNDGVCGTARTAMSAMCTAFIVISLFF